MNYLMKPKLKRKRKYVPVMAYPVQFIDFIFSIIISFQYKNKMFKYFFTMYQKNCLEI